MLIAFSGGDRAGRNTVIAALRDELERQGRPVTVSRIALGRRSLFLLDLLLFKAMRLRVEKIRGRILVMDGYFDDSTRSRLLRRLIPRPDIAVVVDEDAGQPERPTELHVSGAQLHTAHHVIVRLATEQLDPPRTQAGSNALRLLLDDPRIDPDELDWTAIRAAAERGGVIVRLADGLVSRGEDLPPRVSESAAKGCARTQRVLEIVDRLESACTDAGVAHAFLKTVERYPDTGRDIDLLIGDSSAAVDRVLLRSLPAVPRRRSWRNRLTGSRTYAAAHGIVIDIWHGRLGRLGEHARLARLLLERARPVSLGVTTCRAPSSEDNLLLIAAQQIYARPSFRLADVYWTIVTLRKQQLNWDYVFATALSTGTVSAVGTYLRYVDRIHVQMFSRPLIEADVLSRFRGLSLRRPQRDAARFPSPRATARLYLQHIGATLESGRWHSAARLSLLPVMALAALATGFRRT